LIIRIDEYFLNKTADVLLARVVVVEKQSPLHQQQDPQQQYSHSFYVMVMEKENKTTIRLDPLTDPEKTDGVKLALALVAEKIQEIEKPTSTLLVSKTNIQEFIDRLKKMTTTI
jgi:hypothetical protein